MPEFVAAAQIPGGRKIAVVDDADFFNAEGANCLLKTLEEPPPRSVLILIGTSPARQLPTIRSRCQLIRFDPLPAEIVAELLLRGASWPKRPRPARGPIERRQPAAGRRAGRSGPGGLSQHLGEAAVGSAVRPAGIVEADGGVCRSGRPRGPPTPPAVAADRRPGPRISIASCYARSAAAAGRCDPKCAAAERWRAGPATAAVCLDRCLDAAEQIDRNANQATLIECWLDDLAGGRSRQKGSWASLQGWTVNPCVRLPYIRKPDICTDPDYTRQHQPQPRPTMTCKHLRNCMRCANRTI